MEQQQTRLLTQIKSKTEIGMPVPPALLEPAPGDAPMRPMNYFALSYDHRIIDGREAVLFLVAVKEALEDPARLLIEV